MSNWPQIKADYISGGFTLEELSAKYGVSFSMIQKKSAEEKWKNLKKKKRRNVEEKIIEKVARKEVKTSVTIHSAADIVLQKTTELLATMSITSLESLKTAASTLKILKEVMDIKGDADTREQEARIAKLQREAEKEDDTITQVDVVFAAGPEEWNG